MENEIMSMEEIEEKVKQPLKGLTGVRFMTENFTTLTFRRKDVASIEFRKLTPSYPDLFAFDTAPEFSRYFKTDYARVRLRPCADNMNRFDWRPDVIRNWRYLNVFERLMESPNITSWSLLYARSYWNTGTDRYLVVSLPYLNKYEETGGWHEHNLLQTSYLDEEGCLNIEIKSQNERRKKGMDNDCIITLGHTER